MKHYAGYVALTVSLHTLLPPPLVCVLSCTLFKLELTLNFTFHIKDAHVRSLFHVRRIPISLFSEGLKMQPCPCMFGDFHKTPAGTVFPREDTTVLQWVNMNPTKRRVCVVPFERENLLERTVLGKARSRGQVLSIFALVWRSRRLHVRCRPQAGGLANIWLRQTVN
jgi:hypothetical protein